MNRNTWFILLLLLLWMACSVKEAGQEKGVVDVGREVEEENYGVENLSAYVDSLQYIPLQTTSEGLIKKIAEVYLIEDRIYVIDEGKCLVFSATDGRYIGNVGKQGNGPGEYVYIRSIDFSSGSDRIVILDYPNTLLLYTREGRFIKNITVNNPKEHLVTQVREIDSNTYLCDLSSWKNAQYKYALYDSLGEIKHLSIDHTPVIKSGFNFSTQENGIINQVNGELHYMKRTNDTLYVIRKDKQMMPSYILRYGKFKKPLEQSVYLTKENKNSFVELLSMKESRDFMFMQFKLGKWALEPFERKFYDKEGKCKIVTATDAYAVFSKKEGRLKLLKQPVRGILGLNNDVDNGLPFWPDYISEKGEMVMHVTADRLIDYSDGSFYLKHEKLKTLSLDSNPVIIVVRLKK